MARLSALALLLPLALACSGESSAPVGTTSTALSGPVELRVTNIAEAATPATATVMKVFVTVTRIDARVGVHADGDEGGWMTVFTGKETIDLMSLTSGSFASIGIAKLPAGDLEQLRLFVSDAGPNYVVMANGVTHRLLVPSGDESGIKVIGDFDLPACASGHVSLNFSGDVVVHPAGDEWILRSVIRLGDVSVACPSAQAHREGPGDVR